MSPRYPHEWNTTQPAWLDEPIACVHCGLSDYCSDTECPVRLRAALDTAVADTIERAAKVCEERRAAWGRKGEIDADPWIECDVLAGQIRALKEGA